MRGPRKFCQGGPTLTLFFYGRREDPNTTKSGLSSARQQNAIKMAFRWRADDGSILNDCLVAFRFKFFQGIPTSIATKPYILANFQEGRSRSPVLPLDPRMLMLFTKQNSHNNLRIYSSSGFEYLCSYMCRAWW